jgi:AsmA protein
MALQSNKMTMLGHGRIDLGTEKLNLEWITKPRKGIGISASMITNPYIKLGGTLGKPAIELKPMQAVASTGAAVATLGISYVAKGMLDRVTAEKKVCKQALEEIAKAGTGN